MQSIPQFDRAPPIGTLGAYRSGAGESGGAYSEYSKRGGTKGFLLDASAEHDVVEAPTCDPCPGVRPPRADAPYERSNGFWIAPHDINPIGNDTLVSSVYYEPFSD